ncbi:MAG: cysteine desulfurase, partial [bacterium]
GGPQENAKRAGTENLAGITGFATALELCQEEKSKENHRLQKLRDSLIQSILTTIPDSYLTGDLKQRLPGHASFVFKGVDADSILMHLDLAGISASSGSACNTGMPEPSNVLLAMGIEDTLALSALRLTLGRKTTPEELETVVSVLSKTIQKLRRN